MEEAPIVVVSQLAIGDAYLARRFLVEPLRAAGFRVFALCNQNNKFIFGDTDVIVEDWPLSTRRFKSVSQFRLLLRPIPLARGSIVIVPSGHFLEKLYCWMRSRGRRLIAVRLIAGLRRRMNNQFIGELVRFKAEIPITSRDAYGAHFEVLCKVFEHLGMRGYLHRTLVQALGEYIDRFNIKQVVIQASASDRRKAASLDYILAIARCAKELNLRISIVSDRFRVRSRANLLTPLTPQEYIPHVQGERCLLFLTDSFLVHHSAVHMDNVFVYVSRMYGYEWVPPHVTMVTSAYSLACRVMDSIK